MYVYRLSNDGISCSVRALRHGKSIPDGYTLVPPELECKRLYMVDGELTNDEPAVLTSERVTKEDYEVKIHAKMRDLAIKDLKKSGDLPEDFEDQQ
jgi:hypothetical protein